MTQSLSEKITIKKDRKARDTIIDTFMKPFVYNNSNNLASNEMTLSCLWLHEKF